MNMIPDGAIASGVISKIINDLTDVSKTKIKKAVEDKKNNHKSLESQLYNLIVSVLKELSDNSYDGHSDKIYNTAEKLLKGFIEYGKEDEDTVRYAMKNILSCVDDDKCIEFKRLLIHEISKEEYNELYREIRLLQGEKEYRKTDRIEQKVDNFGWKLENIRKNYERIIRNTDKAEKFQNNKKQDYIDNWNSRLFLHIDNDERPLTLADAFIMPDYNYRIQTRNKIFLDKDTMDEIIKKFIKYKSAVSMLITGVPGIGKTSIVSWIANKHKENNNVIILKFRDWERDELNCGLLKAICNTLNCFKWDLNNKIIVLDGFDEIKYLDNGDNLLKNFMNDFLDFRKIKIIVTSRKDYIDENLFQHVLELIPFQINKVKQFYYIITGKKLKSKFGYFNLDVLGIPVILYMAIMSEIDITKEATKPELYSKIFAEKGGIFDKFTYSGFGYDYGNQILRDNKNIKEYLKFLREIAFDMFDKNNLSLKKDDYKLPKLNFQGAYISILEFPIKHFFENTNTIIEFVHKSIYEYFISEFIVQEIKQKINSTDYQKKLAAILGHMLINNTLTPEIIEFMKYNVRRFELRDNFDKIHEVFQLMLQDGMTYYAGIIYKNIIDCEMNIFVNMLEIVHLWEFKKINLNFDNKICDFLRYNKGSILNLRKMELINSNLSRIDFRYADLRKANLVQSTFRYSDLSYADLRDSCLIYSDFQVAGIKKIKLSGALIDEKQAELLKGKCDLRGTKIYIGNKTSIECMKDIDVEKILDYEEFCKIR